jgi:hypothetical protein
MEAKNSIEETLNILPKRLIFSGYLITVLVVAIFVLFFVILKISQNYETPVELSYVDSKIIGRFSVPGNYDEVLKSDSVQIYIEDNKIMGTIRRIIPTEGITNHVYIDVYDTEGIINAGIKEELLPRAYTKTVIKSTFLQKILKKQFLK